MPQLAITVLGHDRPGIIAAVTSALAEHGGNLEDSSMTLLRGHFAMTLIVSTDAASAEVERALVERLPGRLLVAVRAVPPELDSVPVGDAYVLTRARRRPRRHRRGDHRGAGRRRRQHHRPHDPADRSLYVVVAEVELRRRVDVAGAVGCVDRASAMSSGSRRRCAPRRPTSCDAAGGAGPAGGARSRRGAVDALRGGGPARPGGASSWPRICSRPRRCRPAASGWPRNQVGVASRVFSVDVSAHPKTRTSPRCVRPREPTHRGGVAQGERRARAACPCPTSPAT